MKDDDLSRAQHYRQLAEQFRHAAKNEPHERKHQELLDLAEQYDKLAEKLIRSTCVPFDSRENAKAEAEAVRLRALQKRTSDAEGAAKPS